MPGITVSRETESDEPHALMSSSVENLSVPAVTIRDATEDEAESLTELAMRSKAHWGYDDRFMAMCRMELTVSPKKLRADSFVFRVAVREERLVGFHALEWIEGNAASLEALFVEPDCIGAGHGRRLVSDAIRIARARGVGEILIEGDPHADGFYRGVGAARIGRRPSGSIPGRWLPLYRLVT